MSNIQALVDALEKISKPIAYLQNEAEKQGCKLDGVGAIQLSNNANWLSSIANQALADYHEAQKEDDGLRQELLKVYLAIKRVGVTNIRPLKIINQRIQELSSTIGNTVDNAATQALADYHKSQKEDWNVYINERSKAATDFSDSIHLCDIDWNNDNEKWKYLAEHPGGLGQLYAATINTFTAGAEWPRKFY